MLVEEWYIKVEEDSLEATTPCTVCSWSGEVK